MKLTDEQRLTVDQDGSCLVKACPGSGKTRAIIAKLMKVALEVEGTPRKIACITYTNAAVHEITRRINRAGGLPESTCEISTIHTFCLQNVLRPFGHLLKGHVTKDFGILGPDNPELFSIGGEIFSSQINNHWFRDLLLNIKRRDQGIFHPENIDEERATEFYNQITALGLLTFGDIVYYSEKLANSYKFIRRSLGSKFHRIIVDEFQDTSPEQASILLAIARENRSALFLVGDENQSIFGFSDARPDIFHDFANNGEHAIVERPLTGNFRCSAHVASFSEKICPRIPPMEAVGETKDFDFRVEIHNKDTALAGITQHFLPVAESFGISRGNCAILAPQWFELRSLGRSLSSQGIPVVGPGSRPYKRASEFTHVAEAAAECAIAPSVDAVLRLERAVNFCLSAVCRGQVRSVDAWSRRRAVCMLKREAKRLFESGVGALRWIEDMANFAARTLSDLGMIDLAGEKQIAATGSAMAAQIQELHRNEAATNFGIRELAIFSNPSDSIQLCTIHSAKGLEWDAVALVDLHEGKMPHARALDVDESKRLLYVGCTRAKKVLMLFTHDRRTPTRFLQLVR